MAERDYLKTAKELEKERRKLLRNVMATIPDSLLILDRTLLIKTANRSFYRLFQVKPKEVIGRGITDMLGNEDGKLSAKLAALLGTKDRVENHELHYQSAKLGERIFNITARGIIVAEEEEEEEEEEELVVIRDITERKRAEEMLRRTEENFRRSLDDSPLGIRIVNSDGETTYANRAMLDIYGYASIEELKAIPVKERYTPESYAQHQMRKEKRQRGEYVPSNYEISIVRKGGEIRHLEVFRKEVLWNGHTQFQVVYQDITERKAAEEALKDSEERLKATVMNAPIGIATSGADRYFLSANDAFRGLLGYTEAELQKMSFKDITHPEDIKESVARMDDIVAGKIASFSQEKRYIKKDGKVIIGKVMVSAVRDHEGRPYLYIAELEDITERKRLEEKTTYLASFPELNPNPILELDLEGNLRYINPAAKSIFPDLASLGIKHPFLADWTGIVKELQSNRGKVVSREVSVDGSFYDQVISPVAGNQIRLYARNITERKRTEEALRQSEEKYRSLVDNVRLGIFRSTPGPSGKFLEVSKAMKEITGYSRKELLRMDVSSLYVHPEERESVTEEIASAREKMTKELNFRKKDGTEIVVADTKTPVRDSAGEILYFDGVLEDVTEHKQAEEMLRQSEEKLRLMFESVAEGIAIVDLKDIIIEVNQKMLDMHGLSTKDKMVGKPILEFVVPRDHKKVQLSMQKTLEEGRIEKLEVSALKSDGSKFFVEVSAGVLRGSSGHPVGSVATLRDITERKQAEEEVRKLLDRESQAAREWQETFDVVTDIVALISSRHEILRINRAGCEATGRKLEELIGKKCYEVVHGLGAPIKECPCVEALKTKESCAGEYTQQGNHYLLTAYPIVDKGGKIASFAHIIKDITARKQAEEQLRKSYEYLDRILNGMSDAVLVIDTSYSIQDMNNCFVTKHNTKRENIIGKKCYEISHASSSPCSGDEHRCPLREIIKTKKPFTIEHTHRSGDGSVQIVEIAAFPFLDAGGEVESIVEVQHDITERKKMQDEIFRFKTVSELAAYGITMLDTRLMITYVNRACAELHGYTRDELIGKPCTLLVPEDQVEAVERLFEESEKTGGFTNAEIVHIRKDGKTFPALMSGTTVKDNSEKPLYTSIIFTDITEQKKMQESLYHTGRLASIGELAAGVAHEINNPLTSVMGFSKLLLAEDLSEEVKKDLGVIYSNTQRIATIVKNLLTFARKYPTQKVQVNVNEVLGHVLETRSYQLKLGNINIVTQFTSPPPSLIADPHQLEQVFLNIVLNAEQAMTDAHGRGTLTIKTELLGNMLRISFADDGPGISKQDMEKLFTPFFTTKLPGKGTGLGLSICHGIATEHGGRIHAESEPGKGATFIVELPLQGNKE